ncbi:MAG: purine-binding chemotaxis protein CheW [Nostocales cyanobacterium]|nr:MAG: purine-binding chemotaxis protein CheW [Nostocales cyanobacterium]TAF18117.1 MAG: purine-binding chemotaxis protein CheW [Nostocales cyanobacterium]
METKQKFLSFNLGVGDQGVISLEHIIEVLQVSLSEICVVPQMPNCVLGIYSWRGEMLWLVDLEEMLGYPPVLQSTNLITKMMVIVLENEGKHLGLMVRQLTDIELLDQQQMKKPSQDVFYPAMTPFLQGYVTNGAEQMVFFLNAVAIIKSPMWEHHN